MLGRPSVMLGVGELRWGCGVGPWTCIELGLRSAFLPSAAALALYLLAAIPLAPLPPPNARAGISEGPDPTFCICWGWGRGRACGGHGCTPPFSITPRSRAWETFPRSSRALRRVFFNRSPNTRKNQQMCSLFSPLCFSPPGADGRCRSRRRGLHRCGARCDASGCCGREFDFKWL